MALLLLVTTACFACISVFAPRALAGFASRRRLRRPHSALVLVFRLWFAVLAAATLWLLLRQLRSMPVR